MPSLKTRVARVLFRSGLTEALGRILAGRFLVLGYHRIRPDEPNFSTPFDDGVFGPTARQFREQMLWLSRRRQVLSEAELISLVYSRRPLPARGAVITFDDGYRDNYTLALPVLRELGLPAIFFIPTAAIEERKLGWWDLISYLVRHSKKPSMSLAGREYPLGGRSRQTVTALLQAMKLEKAEKTRNLLAELSQACGVELPSREMQTAELMTWEEIRDASANGVSIASHSHTHRILKTLDRRSLVDELRTSKSVLETRTGCPVQTISYPGGTYDHFDRQVQEEAARAGYRLGFSFQTGVNDPAAVSAFDVKRLGTPSELARFAAMAVLPQTFRFSERTVKSGPGS